MTSDDLTKEHAGSICERVDWFGGNFDKPHERMRAHGREQFARFLRAGVEPLAVIVWGKNDRHAVVVLRR